MGRAGAPYATDTLISLAKNEYEHLDSRNLDMLMSTGEIISTVIMTQTLRKLGLKAVAVTGWQAGIITDDHFGDATIKRIDTKKILSYLEKGYLAVVAGFQGISEDGEITTLGRGGSDTSAVILGVALEAEYVDIFTDVIGVMTADPRIVPEARILEGLTYTEAAEIIQQGAKVIHDKAMNIAREYRVPIRVRSLNDEGKGRLKGLAQFRVKLNGKKEDNLLMFQLLASKGISIDLINLFPDIVAFVVEETKALRVKEILEKEGFELTLIYPCAKISLVGSGMADRPGVVADMVEALRNSKIEILQTSDSHVTISCLVHAADMEKAIQVLHRKFQLEDIC
jgi:aspartate kinase